MTVTSLLGFSSRSCEWALETQSAPVVIGRPECVSGLKVGLGVGSKCCYRPLDRLRLPPQLCTSLPLRASAPFPTWERKVT